MSGALPPDPGAQLPPGATAPFGALPPPDMHEDGVRPDVIPRERPEPTEQRRKLVKRICGQVRRGRTHFKRDFQRMKDSTEFVLGAQWETDRPTVGADEKDNRYVCNLTLRHVTQLTAQLYPSNPKVIARKRPKLIGTTWDGDMQSLAKAQQAQALNAQAASIGLPPMPLDPLSQAVLSDYAQVQAYDKMATRVGKTLEMLYQYNVDEQVHSFKQMMKMTVRRTAVTGVGYVKLGFQRAMQMRPEIENRIADMSERLATIQRLSADIADDKVAEDGAEAEQLRLAIQAMAQEGQIIVREGLSFDFPDSWSIIPDPKCRSLKGFLGADWVAQEFFLTPDEIEEIYQVDVGQYCTSYTADGVQRDADTSDNGRASTAYAVGAGNQGDDDRAPDLCCVWEVYSRKDGLVYLCCDGYPDFLADPAPPEVYTDHFWPWYPLTMNEAYHAKRLFPPSDVDLMRDMQMELNRSRQGLREHRQANRPMTAVAAGILEPADKDKLHSHPAHALIELNGLQPGQKVGDLLQPVEQPPIKPELYDTSGSMEDLLRVLGDQAASTGSTAGATATETTLASNAANTATGSAIDDLDDLLSSLARAGGQILMLNVSQQTVMEVCGQGAVWPELDKTTVAKNVYLEVEAGSTGRPNKAQDVNNLVQLIPLLQRIPGISPEWMAREIIKRMDDRLDLTEAFLEGSPSMETMNRQGPAGAAPLPPGRPDAGGANDPSQQGNQGQFNNQAPPPTNGAARPRDIPTSAETMPTPGQPDGVQPTKGVGPATP